MSDLPLDRRIHPWKADVAAEYLRGVVEAAAFVEGKRHRVVEPLSDLLADQMGEARVSQALYGEHFTVYQTQGYWAWGQLETDGYVGWISTFSLAAAEDHGVAAATHIVAVPLTRATDASIKVLGNGPMPLGAQVQVLETPVSVRGSSAPFAQTDAGAIPAAHLRRLDARVEDWVAVAERLVDTPYVWGGRSGLGLDCSALVQLALQQAGFACPRDSDMQEEALGERIDRASLQRADLAFWPGHVGIMVDNQSMLHANAFAMSTCVEPLSVVEARVGRARTIKRLD